MDQRQPLLEHLRELRSRLIRAVIAFLLGTTVSFLFTERIIEVLKLPAGDVMLIRTEVVEYLSTYFKVSLLAGLVLSLPVIVYQLVMFIRPALLPKEKRYLYVALPGVSLSFLAGVLFGYFVLLPPALGFLLSFGSDVAEPQIRISNYVSVLTTLLLWLGLAFEMPLVLYLLARLGIVSPHVLARQRRWAIVVAFIMGGVITPTFDPLNQSLVAVPLILLYELGTQLSKLAWRRRRADTGQEATESGP